MGVKVARKLFGTDGVRGVAGEFLSAELALALARAATAPPRPSARRCSIIRDTRESGEMLEAAVAAGVSSAGGDALLGGVLPTPAAPLLARTATASTSRSCCRPRTTRTPTTASSSSPPTATSSPTTASTRSRARSSGSSGQATAIGRVRELRGAGEDYLRELHSRFDGLDLSGVDVLLDCANGATFVTSRRRSSGASARTSP